MLNALHANYQADELQKLELAECLQEYATALQSTRRHLLLVAGEDKFPNMDQNTFMNGSRIYWGSSFFSTAAIEAVTAATSYDWMCSGLSEREAGNEVVCARDIEEIREQTLKHNSWSTSY